MIHKYDWIETDKAFFGKPNGLYDFDQHNPKEVAAKLPKLQEMKNKLSRAVNTRAVNLLGKEEEQVITFVFIEFSLRVFYSVTSDNEMRTLGVPGHLIPILSLQGYTSTVELQKALIWYDDFFLSFQLGIIHTKYLGEF